MLKYMIGCLVLLAVTCNGDAFTINRPDSSSLQKMFSDMDQASQYGCKCVNMHCNCCTHAEVPKIHLNDTACLNVTYLSEDIGIEVTFDIDGRVYYKDVVSVANPPPICFDVPDLKEEASLCLKLYDVHVTKTGLTGCAELIAKLAHMKIAEMHLGCFKAGEHSSYSESHSANSGHITMTSTFGDMLGGMGDAMPMNGMLFGPIDMQLGMGGFGGLGGMDMNAFDPFGLNAMLMMPPFFAENPFQQLEEEMLSGRNGMLATQEQQIERETKTADERDHQLDMHIEELTKLTGELQRLKEKRTALKQVEHDLDDLMALLD